MHDADLDEVVARARAGERQAADRLLEEARPRAMAVAMKVLRNPNDAEDAVQDALLKMWRSMDRFEGRAGFFTWLHRIVLNASLDILRRERVRATEPREEQDDRSEDRSAGRDPVDHETPERQLAVAETGRIVRGALQVLSPVHRTAITLREFEERSYDEIAVAVRCPVGTVMSRLHHARRKLADHLRPEVQIGSLLEAA